MYPEDVDRQSRCRLPLPKREELSGAAAQIYDSLADPKGGSIRGLRGPGGIHLHSPQLALHTRALNHYLRREADLSGRLRELAILTTARELDSQIEWTAHEPEALREGLSSQIVDVIGCRRDTAQLDPAALHAPERTKLFAADWCTANALRAGKQDPCERVRIRSC